MSGDILDAEALQQRLDRLAAQLIAAHPDPAQVILIGIRTRGLPLARRLAALWPRSGPDPVVGALDITFFRDDLRRRGVRVPDQSDIPCDLSEQQVILVDDVLFRGRTIRAALEALHHYGRPQVVRLAVLIDRGHRQFPIQPDFVGQILTTDPSEVVRVHLQEQDGEDRVFVEPG